MENNRLGTPAEEGAGLAGSAAIIALGNVTSRVLGLLRKTIIAGLFGATGAVSAFDTASKVPTMIYDLLIGGMLSAALVPVFSVYVSSEDREELWRVVSTVITVVSGCLAALVIILEIAAPQLAWLLGAGYHPETRAIITRSIRILLPSVVFFGLSGVITGLLYSLKRFTYPAFGAAAFNLGIVIAAPLLASRLDIYSLSVGVCLGAFLQLGIQLPGLRDARLRPCLSLRHPALRHILALYWPIALGLVISQMQVAIDLNLTSHTGPQSRAWMDNATTLIQFPHGLIAVAISLAALPSLSRLNLKQDWAGFRQALAQSLRLVLVLSIPATVGLFVLARPTVALLFERGRFLPTDTYWTSLALRYYLLGLVFASIDWPLNYAFYAQRDTLTPALVGVFSVGVYLMVALALLHPLGMIGLVLADSAKHFSHALTMLWLLRRRMGRLSGENVLGATGRAGLSALVMGFITALTLTGLERLVGNTGFLARLLLVAGSALVGLTVYLSLAVVWRVEEITLVWRALGHRWRNLKAPGKTA